MKKFLTLLLAFVMCFALIGCGKTEDSNDNNNNNNNQQNQDDDNKEKPVHELEEKDGNLIFINREVENCVMVTTYYYSNNVLSKIGMVGTYENVADLEEFKTNLDESNIEYTVNGKTISFELDKESLGSSGTSKEEIKQSLKDEYGI